MRQLAFATALIVGIVAMPSQRADACGDKLLSLARGVRLQQAYVAARPAAILAYAPPAGGANTVKDTQFLWSLMQAGHQVQIVQDTGQLDHVLQSRPFDLVVADLAEAPAVARRVASMRGAPSVVPVAHKPSKAVVSAVVKEFGFLVTAPAKSTEHLEVIDRAMKARARTTSVP